MQPWYADDSVLFGRHVSNTRCLKLLTQLGPWFGYYPELAKSWHIYTEAEEVVAQGAVQREGLQMQFLWVKRYVEALWDFCTLGLLGLQRKWMSGCMCSGQMAIPLMHNPRSSKHIGTNRGSNSGGVPTSLFGGIWSVEITDNLWTLFCRSIKQGGLALWIPIGGG
ncbi:hypothetical protein ACHAXS_001037 [Conticribra weissflogii]